MKQRSFGWTIFWCLEKSVFIFLMFFYIYSINFKLVVICHLDSAIINFIIYACRFYHCDVLCNCPQWQWRHNETLSWALFEEYCWWREHWKAYMTDATSSLRWSRWKHKDHKIEEVLFDVRCCGQPLKGQDLSSCEMKWVLVNQTDQSVPTLSLNQVSGPGVNIKISCMRSKSDLCTIWY